MALQHLRSSTAHKRPIPTVMSAGQIAINTNQASPGLFFKDSNGDLVKVGPVHIGTTAPNSSPASVAATALVTGTVYQILTVGTSDFTLVGASANTVGTIFTATGTTTGTGTVSGQQGVEKGEQWLDTTGGTYVLKIYDGTDWRSESGTFVDVSGDTMTGDLVMNNANIVFEGATADDFETTLTVTDPTADRTITLPNVTGTVVTTGDTGSVTSTMIADGTIVNADINASAAIAGTKIDPDFGSQTIETTGVINAGSGTAAAPSVSVGTTDNGIYSPGSDQLAISTNGTQRINIEADGDINIDSGGMFYDATNNRLAIGTQSPSGSLVVSNSGAAGLEFFPASFEIQAYNRATSSYGLARYNAAGHQFAVSGTEKARIDSSGRLLVGTSSDSQETTLKLQGSSAGSGDRPVLRLSIDGTPSGANSTLSAITAENSAGSAGASVVFKSDAAWSNGSSHPSRIEFSTTADGASSPTERMRLRNNGELYLYSLNTTNTFISRNASSAGTAYAVFIGQHSSTSTTTGTTSIHIGTNGNVRNTNNSYGSLSDIKLKENIVDAGSQWDDFKAVRFRKYNFKQETGHETFTQLGVIAQELEAVCPGLVEDVPDLDNEGNDLGTTTKSVKYSILTKKALVALQEAMERIETLEAKVAALEAS